MKTKNLLLFALMFATLLCYSQVGIGINKAEKHTMLDVVSNDKGILIPRLTEEQRNSIPIEEAANGLMIYNTTEDCFNYWNKIESNWGSICGKAGKAVFTVDCKNIQVNGSYLNNVALTSDNSLLVTVTVTKEGSYTISAMSDPNNGYYFTRSGDFLSTGVYTIEIPGYGTPKNFTPQGNSGDKFTLLLNGTAGDTPCNFYIKVQDSSVKPNFRLDCSTVKVQGVYQKDKNLTSENYIEVTIKFDASVNGAPLNIKTNTVDGISFDSGPLILDSQGLTTGWAYQTVKLMGTGAPTTFDAKTMTISSNSTLSSATCEATVYVGYPKMKLMGTGSTIYNVAGTYQLNKMVTSQYNFGLLPESIVKSQGWTSVYSIAESPSAAALTAELLGPNPPDIVVFGFPYTVGASAGAVIKQYLEKKGVVICYMEGINDTRDFLQAIFGTSITAGYTGSGGGEVYDLADIENDPVLNGPFGDIRQYKWGEDSSTTQGVTGLLSRDFIIYSTSKSGENVGSATAFRSKQYNFIFVGDGGFNSSLSTSNSNSSVSYPFRTSLSPKYTPIPRTSWGSNTVYNSVFTGNALAWALERATNNGINPH